MAHGLDEDWEGGDRSPNVKQCEKKSKAPREGKGIGSRRIFTPQFKLQVLDSYRRDLDCRGNQRATARKYGIHRRQIQKWLQMESSLRSSAEASESGEVALNLAAGRQLDVGSASDAGCLAGARQESPPSASPQPPSGLPTDEFVDVDKISDSEDDGGSSSSGASVYGGQERALDFTSAALSKRRFFSPDFKSEVVDAFYRDPTVQGNQRATARKFGIHRRQVQKWLNHEGSVTPTPRFESTECLLDLSQKRKLDAVEEEEDLKSSPLKRLSLDIEVIRQPVVTSVQETALCLVKTPPTPPEVTSSVDLFRPYSLCCAQVADYDPWTHYYPYYGVMDTSYVTKWLTRDAPYYRQTVNDVNRYTPMYS